VAPLVSLLSDDDSSLRMSVIDALGHRESPEDRRKAASALAGHLPKAARKANSDVEVIATAQALGTLAQPASIDALLADIELGTPPDVVEARLMAVAQVPSADAIDSLITFLAKQGRGKGGPQREACRGALREATGENLGNDPDVWRAWWKDAKKGFDFEAAARRRADERQRKAEADEKRRAKKDKKDGK
jgi:HEAT repeat protein